MKRIILSFVLLIAISVAFAESTLEGAVFSPLDSLGRAGAAIAVLSPETLDDGRGDISGITPSGYEAIANDAVPGGFVFNRCHLIAAMLAHGTDRAENLVTGTRQLNTAMLAIETRIRDYIQSTGERVLYKVTPDFQGSELICRGVTVSAIALNGSLEISEYIPNIQENVVIDYLGEQQTDADYILNVKSRRFHKPTCSGASDIKPSNKRSYHGDRESLLAEGYRPCGMCNP